MYMKKALKFLGVLIGVLIIIFIVAVVVDLSNDVAYETVITEERNDVNALIVRVITDATEEKDLKTIVNEVKSEYDSEDAIWLFIHNKADEPFGGLIASARIPYNINGQRLVGAKDKDIIFEMK